MLNMEDKILNGLLNIGYSGNMQKPNLKTCIEKGTINVDFTKLVSYICNQLRNLCNIDEEVNAISSPDDSFAFIMEISSFLKELNCPYESLTSSHVSERLQKVEERQLLLDFLISTLMTSRMVHDKEPTKKIELKLRETPEASNLKQILITLGFPKPPANITAEALFQKVIPSIETRVIQAGNELVGKPIFSKTLNDKQWEMLGKVQQEFDKEYKIRRDMLLTRLDVTIQSFEWSDRTKGMKEQLQATYKDKRKTLKAEPNVNLSNLLSARTDVAIIEKTSSSSVRKNTVSSFQKIIIGQVPDRGGRTNELAPPPPEMPSWQLRTPGPSTSNRGNYNQNTSNRGSYTQIYSRSGNDSNNYSRGNNSKERSNYTPFSNFDTSLSSYSSYKPDNDTSNFNSRHYGNSKKSSYNDESLNRGFSQKRSYITGDEGVRNDNRSQTAFDSAGTYDTNKKVKSYDNFQTNQTSYSEQYVKDTQGNERYHQQRGGRSNYRRGRGRGNNYY